MKRVVLVVAGLMAISSFAVAQYNKELIVEPVLKTDTTSIGQKIVYPQFENDEVTIARITLPPGASTGWHKHSIPVFAYVEKGELTVELENGTVRQFSQNTSFAEMMNTFHNGTNKGKDDVILIAFYLGEKGKPLSVRRDTTQIGK